MFYCPFDHYLFVHSACSDPSLLTGSWFGRLEASGWLTHVEQILKATKHIVHTIQLEGNST